MRELLKLLVLRGRVEALPDAWPPVLLALATVLAVHLGGVIAFGALSASTAASLLVTLFFLLLLPWLVLRVAARAGFYRRVLLALAVLEAATALAAVPVTWMLRDGIEVWSKPTVALVAVLGVLVVAWAIAAQARIWRQGTLWPWIACVALVLGSMVAQWLLRLPLAS